MASARLDHVSRAFGARIALDEVSFDANAGEVVGVVGPNGAGKTTLLRVMAGLIRPSSGEVLVDGSLTIRYFGGEHTLPPDVSARRWSKLWGIDAACVRRIGVLSRGTRQRLGLEAVLHAHERSLILLDEPWEGLDPDASRWLSDALLEFRHHGSAVVVSSHRIHDLATICDRCEFLVDGRIPAGPVVCSPAMAHETRVARLLTAFDAIRVSPWPR